MKPGGTKMINIGINTHTKYFEKFSKPIAIEIIL